MLDAMIAGYIGQANRDIWFVSITDGQVVGFGCCEPERMTSGTWNLLAIGILASYRGRGIGGSMMRYLEDRLRVARSVPSHLDIRLIIDHYCIHKPSKVREWVKQRPRFHLHCTSTHGSMDQ